MVESLTYYSSFQQEQIRRCRAIHELRCLNPQPAPAHTRTLAARMLIIKGEYGCALLNPSENGAISGVSPDLTVMKRVPLTAGWLDPVSEPHQ